jgi:hypothetical protein
MVVRAWWEGADRRLTIRVISRSDVLVPAETRALATTAEEVCAHIVTWLERLTEVAPP